MRREERKKKVERYVHLCRIRPSATSVSGLKLKLLVYEALSY
jgi:hypothetical protein